MSPEAKRKLFLEKSLESAREAARNISDDIHLAAEVWAVVASISNSPEDLQVINGLIAKTGPGAMRSEALAVIAKKLARNKKFPQAREMVNGIRLVDNYWRAYATLMIACHSRQAVDFGRARQFASRISGDGREDKRKEMLDDIDRLEKNPGLMHVPNEQIQESALRDLVASLTKLGVFEQAHTAISEISHAGLRARAHADMATILAEEIK